MTGAVTAVQVGSSPRCRTCSSPIWFGLTAKGRRMPMDPTPVEDGNMVVDRLEQVMDQLAGANESGPGKALPHVRVLAKGEAVDPATPRYVSHFATCPGAERHWRAKARASATPAERGASSAVAPRSAGIGDSRGRPFGEVGPAPASPASRAAR